MKKSCGFTPPVKKVAVRQSTFGSPCIERLYLRPSVSDEPESNRFTPLVKKTASSQSAAVSPCIDRLCLTPSVSDDSESSASESMSQPTKVGENTISVGTGACGRGYVVRSVKNTSSSGECYKSGARGGKDYSKISSQDTLKEDVAAIKCGRNIKYLDVKSCLYEKGSEADMPASKEMLQTMVFKPTVKATDNIPSKSNVTSYSCADQGNCHRNATNLSKLKVCSLSHPSTKPAASCRSGVCTRDPTTKNVFPALTKPVKPSCCRNTTESVYSVSHPPTKPAASCRSSVCARGATIKNGHSTLTKPVKPSCCSNATGSKSEVSRLSQPPTKPASSCRTGVCPRGVTTKDVCPKPVKCSYCRSTTETSVGGASGSNGGVLKIGSAVKILAPADKCQPQPAFERGRKQFILAVITYVTSDGRYKLGTRKGTIGRLFTREELQPRDTPSLLKVRDVPPGSINMFEACTLAFCAD